MSHPELVEATRSLADDGFTTGPKWEACHDLCQSREGTLEYDWVHALVHLIEDDAPNAGYWYRRARKSQMHSQVKDEWKHILDVISTD